MDNTTGIGTLLERELTELILPHSLRFLDSQASEPVAILDPTLTVDRRKGVDRGLMVSWRLASGHGLPAS